MILILIIEKSKEIWTWFYKIPHMLNSNEVYIMNWVDIYLPFCWILAKFPLNDSFFSLLVCSFSCCVLAILSSCLIVVVGIFWWNILYFFVCLFFLIICDVKKKKKVTKILPRIYCSLENYLFDVFSLWYIYNLLI